MIQHLSNDKIDKKAWDGFVAKNGNGKPYNYSGYLDIVAPNWEAIVEISNKTITGVFPLPIRSKLGIRYIYSPFFCQQLGCFGSEDFKQAALEHMPKVAKYCNGQFSGLPLLDFATHTSKLNLVLPYSESTPSEKYNSNRLRDLKKANKAGLKEHEVGTAQSIVQMFRSELGEQTSELTGPDYDVIMELSQLNNEHLQAKRIEIHEGAKAVGGGIFIETEKNITFLFGISDPSGKKNGAMTFLLHQVVLRAHSQGKAFDFEGSQIESLAQFYRSFGGQDEHYINLSYNKLMWPLHVLKN